MEFAKDDRLKHGVVKLYLVSLFFLGTAICTAILCLSYFLPLSALFNEPSLARAITRAIENDDHYKYLIPLLVPTTCWFAIANWIGWEYFRFA